MLSIPAKPLIGQGTLSADLFGGVTAPVGGLADVTTSAPAWHAGAGVAIPLSMGWSLRGEVSLHEYTERRFGTTESSPGAPDPHLQLWNFFLLAQRHLATGDRFSVRARGGLGLTLTGSDQATRRSLFTTSPGPLRRFSHTEPAVRLGVEGAYGLGPGEVFVDAGAVVTALPGGEASSFYRELSDGDVGDVETLISLPLSAGVRLSF